ncbi:hypothetical protein EUX98_g3085 [Antrodiella citrinella]|uniref:polynucleotide adenylyltransferase n=1 Tax=Antrodiella citrinella TaxID=2447956 RepID=A0A4S4MYQ9_9APHY|nr:hypothetical protein EUX98_g3085 [Antrodiella citrinella]
MSTSRQKTQRSSSRPASISPPSSRPETPAGLDPNRRVRRRKKQAEQNGNAEASSSTITHVNAAVSLQPDTEPPADTTTFREEDFVAFDFGDAPEFAEDSPNGESRDVGKVEGTPSGKDKEAEHAGRKRKVAEVDLNDGYSNKKQRIDAASRRAPWAWDVDWDRCQNVAQMLHKEVYAFVEYISPTPVEDDVRSMMVQVIRNAIVAAFPDAQVMPFGSYETKLYLPLGDIDLVIVSKSMEYSRSQSVLHALANTVKRAGITDRVTIIAKAKVPIIKFITRHGRFPVDISVNQNNGVAAGQMIKQFIRELPTLRPLVLIIKSFLSQRSMNEMHPKIRRGEVDPQKNLGTLVMEFFELYGCYFNYDEVGISLRNGGSYYNKAQRGWLDYRSPGLLSIEDPGDSYNDISKGTYNIAKVRTTLAGAYGIMSASAYLHAGYIESRRMHRNVQLRPPNDAEEMSILASVMGVTQETVNHRKLTQEVYDSRVLHRILGIEDIAPVPLEIKHEKSSKQPINSRTQARAAESVQSAWSKADVAAEEQEDRHKSDDVEESRYRAADSRSGQPPKKRRRTGKDEDLHTVYTTDEEEDVADDNLHLHFAGAPDGASEKEDEYTVLSESSLDRDVSSRKELKRSYWLSKGVGLGDIDYSDA